MSRAFAVSCCTSYVLARSSTCFWQLIHCAMQARSLLLLGADDEVVVFRRELLMLSLFV